MDNNQTAQKMDLRRKPEKKSKKKRKKGIWKCISWLCCFKSNINDDIPPTVVTQVDETLTPAQGGSTFVDQSLIPAKEELTPVDESLIRTIFNPAQVARTLTPIMEESIQEGETLNPTRDDSTQFIEALTPTRDNSSHMETTYCAALSQTVVEQKETMEELMQERERKIQLGWEQKLREQQEKFNQELAFLEGEIWVLKAENREMQLERDRHIAQLREKHVEEKLDLAEFIQTEKLEALEQLEQEYERQLLDAEERREQEVQEITQCYEEQMQENGHLFTETLDKCKERFQKLSRELAQTQENLRSKDMEEADIKTTYERLLTEQRETCAYLEDENNMLRTEVSVQEEAILTLTSEVETLQTELQQLRGQAQPSEVQQVEQTGTFSRNMTTNRAASRRWPTPSGQG